MVMCGIWDLHIVGFVQQVNFSNQKVEFREVVLLEQKALLQEGNINAKGIFNQGYHK